MNVRGLAVALAVTAALSACSSDRVDDPANGGVPPAGDSAELTATAQLALSTTEGEPLIDPAGSA